MCNPIILPRRAARWLARIGLVLFLAACGQPTAVLPAAPATAAVSDPTHTPVLQTATETITATATQPATPTATEAPQLSVCSPLEGIALDELPQPDLLKTLFEMPRPGMDEGHHGVDFAYWSRGERKTMRGHPVQAVLAGRVAGVVPNRQPYGYAVIVETTLNAFPADRLAALSLPTPAPTIHPAASLLCPPGDVEGITGSDTRSLYLLYAHLNEPPPVQTGDLLSCGDPIGVVGTTGRSVNDHLHLETRLGPAGATFPTMAHYDNAATEAEMRAYCTWRVSGLFQLMDPMALLTLQP